MLFSDRRGIPGGNWIVEADLRNTDISDLVFHEIEREKAPETKHRENEVWTRLTAEAKSAGRDLFDGELVSIRDFRKENRKFHLRISKSGYKEHHGAYIFNGKQDEWNKQFLPYGFELQNGVAIARIPNAEKLFACFAAASLVETADGKLAYGIRTNLVDCYRSMHSLNSGGRFNGSPHKMVEELTEDPALLYDHVSGMLKQEYINLVDTDIAYHRLTGLSRSLDDLDLTLCVLTRVNLPFDKLNEKLNRGKKYDGLKCVPANSDGMTELLESQEKFPSTIFPTIVMAAPSYGVDPRQVLPEIKILD